MFAALCNPRYCTTIGRGSKDKMKRKVKKIPLGSPLNTSDEDLDLMALVSITDVADAQAAARQRMTARGAALLDAARVERPPEEDGALPLGA